MRESGEGRGSCGRGRGLRERCGGAYSLGNRKEGAGGGRGCGEPGMRERCGKGEGTGTGERVREGGAGAGRHGPECGQGARVTAAFDQTGEVDTGGHLRTYVRV